MANILTKSSLFALILVCTTAFMPQVFFAQGTLRGELIIPGNTGVMSERCAQTYDLVFTKDGLDVEDPLEIFLSNHGQAEFDIDFRFPAGAFPATMSSDDEQLIIPVTIISDGLAEGAESIIWEFAWFSGAEHSGDFRIEAQIVDDYSIEIQSPTDTITWCQNAPFSLEAISDGPIQWSPGSWFADSTGNQVTIIPQGAGWIYATTGEGDCMVSDSIYLDMVSALVDAADTLFICLGGVGITLPGEVSGPVTGFTWTPADTTLSDPLSLTPIANPTFTSTYILTASFGALCVSSDTVVVRVDSLPHDLHIDIAPSKPYYCAGEVVAIFSPTYDSLAYPDLTFNWLEYDATFLTDNGLLNAALQLLDTTLYIRENINNACRSQDSILINVIPPSVPLSVTDTILCPGESFQVSVLKGDLEDPEWEPGDGLSCTKCFNPVVVVPGPPGSTKVYSFSATSQGCPVGASLVIEIPGPQPIDIDGDQTVCADDQVPLTIANPDGLSDFTWNVLNGNASLSCTGCPNPVVNVQGNEIITIGVTAETDDANFCGASGIINLLPGAVMQVTAPALVACEGGTVVATTGHPELTDITWEVFSGGSNLSLSCSQCPEPIVTVNGQGSLRFTAETDDPDICRVTGIVGVGVAAPDVAAFALSPDPAVEPIGQGTEVVVTIGITPMLPATITWIVNGVSMTTGSNVITINANNEVNLVEAIYINSKGCEQRDTISIVTVPPSYKIPNAFTPNNDDINDKFRVILIGNIEVKEFKIFNRWGQLVYDAPVGDVEGWDGKIKNEPAPSDTYVYMATLILPNGRTELVKGDVLLLR